jgi:hypothetical protein
MLSPNMFWYVWSRWAILGRPFRWLSDAIVAYTRLARDAVESGQIGYALIIADKR